MLGVDCAICVSGEAPKFSRTVLNIVIVICDIKPFAIFANENTVCTFNFSCDNAVDFTIGIDAINSFDRVALFIFLFHAILWAIAGVGKVKPACIIEGKIVGLVKGEAIEFVCKHFGVT